jgi:pSer/pThr/pTyr-binding forkhead associated (FHA) protein
MALIVELHDARGFVTRQRLDGRALSVGRALGNDVILDDPYADACHARIAPDESGAWSIADLGSVNGLFANGTRADAAVPVRAGTEVRIGRTLLRFRDTEEALPPALVEEQAPVRAAPVVGEHARSLPHPAGAWSLETTRGRLIVIGAMLAAFAVNGWLTDSTRSPAGTVIGLIVVILVLASIWAAAWAAATRRVDRRFHFLGHLAVVSATLLGGLVAAELNEWLTFLFPGTPLVVVITAAAYLALVAAHVAGHLGVSGTLPARRRWRAGALVAGVIVGLVGLSTLADDTFSDSPRLVSALKPLAPAWIPAEGVDDFGGAIRKAKNEADDVANKEPPP